jgi:hypothetical protein
MPTSMSSLSEAKAAHPVAAKASPPAADRAMNLRIETRDAIASLLFVERSLI